MSEVSNSPIFINFENHKIPEFKEVKNKEWVYFGEDNMYADYLIELYLRSAKHNAIVNGKCNYIMGGGLVVDDKTANVTQKAIGDKFLKMLSGSLPEIIKDFELFNSISIEVIYNKAGTNIAEFAYMPMSKIRTNADESVYYYSNNWNSSVKQDAEKTGLKEFKPFDFKNKVKGSQLLVAKLKSPKNGVDKNVYGVPNYIGSTTAIETDIEISNFHLNNTKSGFSMGTMINFNNGTPPTEEQEKIEKKIKKKATGTDVAGGLVITFNKEQTNAPSITPMLPNDLDKQFIELSKHVNQEIFTGHGVTSPVLFGVATEGALGQRNEMIDAYELFQSTYVNGRQKFLEDIINDLAYYFGIANQIYFKKTSPVKSVIPDSLINQAYTPNEVRELLGLKPLEQDKSQASQGVIDAINTLSPLVANKVLESMTADEIRSLVGLKPALQQPSLFAEEKKKICSSWFKGLGAKEEDYTILFERDFEGQSDEDCLLEFSKQTFKEELTPNQKAIIDLLTKDVLTPSDSIAKVLNISVNEVNDLIKGLVDSGHLTSGSEPTKKGEKASEGAKTDNLEVKYKYGWRTGVTPDDKSRDFCKEMLAEKRLYSRSEIEGLNNEQDLDVWDSRGGWWNKGGVSVPYCRHIWKQVVVRN